MQLHTPRDVGNLIRARRLNARLTQHELAKRVGVSRLWLSQTESGNPGASLDLILRTMAELGVVLTAPEGIAADDTVGQLPVEGPDIAAILDAARRR